MLLQKKVQYGAHHRGLHTLGLDAFEGESHSECAVVFVTIGHGCTITVGIGNRSEGTLGRLENVSFGNGVVLFVELTVDGECSVHTRQLLVRGGVDAGIATFEDIVQEDRFVGTGHVAAHVSTADK